MYLCARIAPTTGAHNMVEGFHGRDIIVRALSGTGFEAESRFSLEPNMIVRLRLPGAGNVLARVLECLDGLVRGEFINPLGENRLRMALAMCAPAYATA